MTCGYNSQVANKEILEAINFKSLQKNKEIDFCFIQIQRCAIKISVGVRIIVVRSKLHEYSYVLKIIKQWIMFHSEVVCYARDAAALNSYQTDTSYFCKLIVKTCLRQGAFTRKEHSTICTFMSCWIMFSKLRKILNFT